MNHGKYSARHKRRRLLRKRPVVLMVAVLLLVMVTIGGTMAYLMDRTNPVENKFEQANVNIEINEPGWTDGGSTKSNVTIVNNGNVFAQVRAKIVVTWQYDETNAVYAKAPVSPTDYTITIPTNTGWSGPDKDGWYLFDGYVAPNGGQTGVLIDSCSPVSGNTPDGCHLVVDIIAEAIQTEGISGDHPWGINEEVQE